ncbi:MAG: hypothetical protein FGM24_09400 [Candidatus Kapabacteria bacterium]|nr:hypothetical protein [Candidatus Kapabacteria bacterium]
MLHAFTRRTSISCGMQQGTEHLYQAAAEALRQAKRAVITTHMNPDGDAIGSVCALRNYLLERGVAARVLLPTPAPENLLWIAGAEDLEVFDAERHPEVIASADTMVVLDVNVVKRFAPVDVKLASQEATIIGIDHHVQPEAFARIQCTDTVAPATCSMLVDLLGLIDPIQPLSPAVAEPLYTGIMTDTGNFRFPRTTSDTHRKIAALIDAGADPAKCYELTFNQSSVGRMNMLGEALCSMRTFHDGRFCVMVITSHDLQRHGCTSDDVEGFVHHTLGIAGVRAGVMIVELDGVIKLSFRSKGDTYVRDLAATYGGGGHLAAAGARVYGRSLDDVVIDVIANAQKLFRS